MDYKRYQELMIRYKELVTPAITPQDTKESLIEKLTDVSKAKKQILAEANDIIRDGISKYEKEPGLLDADTVAGLEELLVLLRSPKGNEGMSDPLDPTMSLHIARLLLKYYQSQEDQDPEKVIRMIYESAYYDIILKEHLDDYDSTPYAAMAERYLADIDKFSDITLRRLVNCLTIGGYNRKDRTFGLKKLSENKELFQRILEKGEEDFSLLYYCTLYKSNALAYALNACFKTREMKKRGITPEEPPIDLDKYAPLMAEIRQELEDILNSERARAFIYDRVSAKLYIAETDYHLGRITLDELFEKNAEYSRPCEDYTGYEKCSALLLGRLGYLEYMCAYSDHDSGYVQAKSVEAIEYVLENAKRAAKELSEESQYFSDYRVNGEVLQMLCTSSAYLDFDFFKRTVLNATIYANKELYVHTMMVKEIAFVLLEYILEHDPKYLEGVAGHSWEECRDHKPEIMALMEDCALLHDIGKYFCLDFVNNSSRRLTDDEFEIIKEHPTNFSKIYQGGVTPRIGCIRDCAELHHLWYNGQGGYPSRPHTTNKPFVNILTIADCIDAATDNIGRPYGFGKTLEQVMAEFDADRDTRYSGYISELLHVPEIQEKIEYIISEKRKDIYCEIYLENAIYRNRS